MILKVFSIKDTVVGNFQAPFYQYNRGAAIRAISNAVNDERENEIKANYKDKQLYELGEYNDETGELKSKVEFVVNLNDLKQKAE